MKLFYFGCEIVHSQNGFGKRSPVRKNHNFENPKGLQV